MTTHEWIFRDQPVEADYTLHKAVPEAGDTPGVKAYVVIEEVRENGGVAFC